MLLWTICSAAWWPLASRGRRIYIFIRFRFFVFFMNLMVPGTSLELIWRSLEVSGQHFDDFWGHWKVIGISLNSVIWLADPRIQGTHPGEGKKVDPRGHTATNLIASRMQYRKNASCQAASLEGIVRLHTESFESLEGIVRSHVENFEGLQWF